MSSDYHTPIPFHSALNASVINAPMGELDETIGDILTGAVPHTKLRVGTGNEASAALQIASTTKGFLPPRMTTVQRDAISSPAEGLLIWNTTMFAYNYYTGGEWIPLAYALGAMSDVVSAQALNGTGSVNISGGAIPTSGQDLLLRLRIRSTMAAVTDVLRIRFNGDSGAANYAWTQLYAAASQTIANDASDDGIDIICPGASATAGRFLDIDLHILNYRQTSKINGYYRGVLAENTLYNTWGGFEWVGGAAITSVAFQAVGGNMDGIYSLYVLGA